MSKLRLSQKLHVLCMANAVIINEAIANQFDIPIDCIISIITAREKLEYAETSALQRKNLTLGDKLRVLDLMDLHNNKSLVGCITKIDRKTVRNILFCHEKHLSDELRGTPTYVKRPFLSSILILKLMSSNLSSLFDLSGFLSQSVTSKLVHYVLHKIIIISNFLHQMGGCRRSLDDLPCRNHSSSMGKGEWN